METTSKNVGTGAANFIPVKDITDNLDEVSVGHAGIYPVDIESETTTIENIIPLGLSGGRHLVACETGITNFVRCILALKLEEKKEEKDVVLSQFGLTSEDLAHLPNDIVGVWIHYLTAGIERDFGITWEREPYTLAKSKKRISSGPKKFKPTKAMKNACLEKQDLKYWRPFIESGEVTREEAYEEMEKAYKQQLEWEKDGFYLSPNKTDGVLLFDYKNEIKRANNREDGYKIYSKNSLIVVIPNVSENYYDVPEEQRKEKLTKEINKTGLEKHKSVDSFMKSDWGTMEISKKEILGTCDIKGVHIVKIGKSGLMKDRWICLDCDDKKTGEQVLHMLCGANHTTFNVQRRNYE